MLISEVDPLARAINAISEHGYAIIDDFLAPSEIEVLADTIKAKWLNGEMVSAKTGKAGLKNKKIRGDYIAWLDEADTSPAVMAYFRKMEMLRLLLNTQLFMNVQELETHVAVYPVGSTYQKHLDQFSHGFAGQIQHRQLSAVLYLNQNWQSQHGGELRLHINDCNHLDISPNAGRIVLFLSAKFWHEVLPAQRERLSLTGWFRTRSHLVI
ncbi:MAG: 2OG-Fe(II) oxygenase [Methylotenera sp.]|jgi:SM-20-related protein